MKGYKAFEKGMVCLGKQYAENTVFEEKNAVICKRGMHFCKYPLDVLEYYPFVNGNGEISEFAEVEALDGIQTNDERKFCTKKLKIGAKISFAQLVQASVNFSFEKTECSAEEKRNNEDSAQIGSSGYSAQIGSSGYSAQIGSSGDYAKIGSSGNDAVICCAGNGSIVKAKIGSWITLSEWKYDCEKKRNVPVCVKTERVDGEKIKEDTFYMLKNGEFVEVQ